MTKIEQWEIIPGYEGFYIASTFGNIRSLDRFIDHWKGGKSFKRGKILNPTKRSTGYLYLDLVVKGQKKPYGVHRLIAATFHGLDLNNAKLYACHKNDIRDDNRSKNIFIGTAQDNTNDCILKGRNNFKNNTSHKKGEQHKLSILKEENILDIRKLLNEGVSQKQIAEKFNVDASNISKIKNGKRWAHI